jgi:hypothetical protein
MMPCHKDMHMGKRIYRIPLMTPIESESTYEEPLVLDDRGKICALITALVHIPRGPIKEGSCSRRGWENARQSPQISISIPYPAICEPR